MENINWEYLDKTKIFEIHCWFEEETWIKVALGYGDDMYASWLYGKIISGPVTQIFRDMVLNLPKPEDTEPYNKMTPFFSLFLDNGFSSERYGTEINVRK